MKALAEKKEIVLQRELTFANAIGAAVFEKPKVSFWMVFIPFFFFTSSTACSGSRAVA